MNASPDLSEVVPGLYRIGLETPGSPAHSSTHVYYLTQQDLSVTPSLEETWISSNTNMNGWYLFMDQEIDEESGKAFVVAARQNLPVVEGAGSRQIVWLHWTSTPSPFPYDVLSVPLGPFPVPQFPQYKNSQADVNFQWSSLGLEAASSFAIQWQNGVLFDLAGDVFRVWSAISSEQVTILYGPGLTAQDIGVYQFAPPIDIGRSWLFQIPLTGPAAGALHFGIGLDPGWLYSFFGCCFQFSYPPANSLFYSIFSPAQPGTDQSKYLGFHVRFHPLFPQHPERTRFALDLSGTGPGAQWWSPNSLALRSNYFSTPAGLPVTLKPCLIENGSPNLTASSPELSPPGFAFGRGPVSGSTAPWQHYLTPMGYFEITSNASPADSIDVMGGMFAEEYLRAGIGDWVEFVPGKAAFAPAFHRATGNESGPSSPAEQPVLIETYTTSWMKYPSGPAHSSRAYFSQVSSSVYYGQVSGNPGQKFPMAVSALFSHVEEPETFPIVPYMGIYAAAPGQRSPNQNVPPPVFSGFESQILTSMRHGIFPPNPSGPIFLSPRADNALVAAAKSRFLLAAAPAMATTHTPQGLLVKLNQADSTWNTLFLAVSPEQGVSSPESGLSIEGAGGAGIVDPALSNVLMKNQLFLVVSDPAHLGTFHNEIAVGGFNFQLDVGPGNTLLIFKFNTSASLAQLAEHPNLWASTADFVADVDAAQAAIRNAIAIADEHADSMGHPFAYFSRIAQQKEWTGILALNCAINGNGMPLDFQMLLGGIKGQLRAHHFGIEMNKVQSGASPERGLDQSSLFGVIYYQNPDEPAGAEPQEQDLDYEVETLTVVFSNSVITQFAVQVGLTINQLFGRETKLVGSLTSPPPKNTLVIAGQYQKHGSVGTVTFLSETPFVYEFPAEEGFTRVIREVLINQASLVPVSSTVESPGTLVKANFLMGGQIFFSPNPFPNSDGLDLFSYGIAGSPGTGIAFSGLTANIAFTLNAAGKMAPGTKTVTANLSPFTLTPSSEAIRPQSLMASLPLQFSRFVFSETGLTVKGTNPIHVLQLEGGREMSGSPALTSSPPGSTALAPSPMAPYGTTTPHYALEYDLPLGSLGSLSDIGVGIMAKLLLAWGPSQVVPDNDGAAVLVQLPALTAGVGGFTLQGILQTTFGDANLLKVDLDSGETVYAILFNNIKLSILGYTFPPGYVIDFTLFAGSGEAGTPRNTSNIGWFLSAYQT
ncbi:MAG TPA: hypothetical protein VGJ51_18520 [Candidatus Angelobacter sp.]